MPAQSSSAAPLEALSAADSLARAASLWLRREETYGRRLPRRGPERRDLLAGLVAGLGQWLRQDEQVLVLTAYALSMLEHEPGDAMDTARRLTPAGPRSMAYADGLQAAERLVAEMATDPAAAAG